MKPALFDARSFFDKAWWACQSGGQLDGLDEEDRSSQIIAAVLGILTPLLGPGSRLPFDPDYALFCWDPDPCGETYARSKTIKPRPPKSPEFRRHLARFKDCLPRLVGGSHITTTDEADDVVSTAAFKLEEAGIGSVVVSGDKDLQQLASDLTRYYCLNKRDELSVEMICERWGVRTPREVALALALIGDKLDGVAGVRGIGPVAVRRLFKLLGQSSELGVVASELASHLNIEQRPCFFTSLEATMLSVLVDGVPDPAPLQFAPMEVLDELNLNAAHYTWARFLGRCQLHQDVRSSLDEEC